MIKQKTFRLGRISITLASASSYWSLSANRSMGFYRLRRDVFFSLNRVYSRATKSYHYDIIVFRFIVVISWHPGGKR